MLEHLNLDQAEDRMRRHQSILGTDHSFDPGTPDDGTDMDEDVMTFEEFVALLDGTDTPSMSDDSLHATADRQCQPWRDAFMESPGINTLIEAYEEGAGPEYFMIATNIQSMPCFIFFSRDGVTYHPPSTKDKVWMLETALKLKKLHGDGPAEHYEMTFGPQTTAQIAMAHLKAIELLAEFDEHAAGQERNTFLETGGTIHPGQPFAYEDVVCYAVEPMLKELIDDLGLKELTSLVHAITSEDPNAKMDELRKLIAAHGAKTTGV